MVMLDGKVRLFELSLKGWTGFQQAESGAGWTGVPGKGKNIFRIAV